MALVKVDIDYKQFENQLKDMKRKMPLISKRMMNKVNSLIKKEARKNMRGRKFDKTKEDGIYKNLYSYSNKDFSAKIGIKKIAYYSFFVEKRCKYKTKKI